MFETIILRVRRSKIPYSRVVKSLATAVTSASTSTRTLVAVKPNRTEAVDNRTAALALERNRPRILRLQRGILQLALACCLFAASATADVRRFSESSILIEGPIVHGDYDRVVALAAAMIAANSELPETRLTKMFQVSLWLNSPGGDVEEAFKIADFVREMWISTYLSDPDVARSMNSDGAISETQRTPKDQSSNFGGDSSIICYSACSLIFLSGIERYYIPTKMGRTVELGFHRPYIRPDLNKQLTADESKAVYLEIEASFKEVMRRYGAPESLITQTFNASSSDMKVLSKEEFDALFPIAEPWFGEYFNAKCGSTKTTGGFDTKEEAQAFVKALVARRICASLHRRDHQRSKIQDYISLERN